MFGGWTMPIGQTLGGPPEPAPPKEPLTLTFPSCNINSPRDPKFSKDLYTLFRQIRKLPDISPEHLESLNVSLEYDVPLDQLIPKPEPKPATPGGAATEAAVTLQSYIPDENAEGEPNETFAERRRELMVPNQHAFETLARTRKDIKLGYFYKFYQSLELVTAYYKPNGVAYLGMPEKFREDLVKNFVESLCWGYRSRLLPPRGPPRVQFQTSRFTTRIDFFAYVTPTSPAERKAGLVEGPLFAVQCRHDDYFVSPGEVSASDEDSASEDTPAGPELATEKKPVVDSEGDTSMKEEATPSTSEVQGVAPPKGETKVEEPTSAETPGVEKSAADIKAEMRAEMKLAKVEEAKRKSAKREEERKVRIKKGSWVEGDVWDTLKEVGAILCTAQERRKGGKNDGGIGKGKVVKKVRHRAIGRDGAWWDEIFLLSAVHSHIALTRVRISSAYLRFLETGNLPNPEHELIKDEKSGWCELNLRRSKWWDLTVPDDRVESARAISAAMRYLERNEGIA